MSDEQSQPETQPQDPTGIRADDKSQPEVVSDPEPESESDVLPGTEPDIPPDRLSINPMSRHHDEDLLKRGIGIRFKGKKRTNVQEYCISEGWVTMAVGKTVDRRGLPLTVKSTGPVEAWFEDLGDDAPVASAD